MPRVVSLLLACSMATGCASLQARTQKVRVVTEPEGAQVAVLEPDGRKDLGLSPAEYQRETQSYTCSALTWLVPVATTALAGAGGFGLAYATSGFNGNDRTTSGWNNGALFAAVGLVVGLAVAAECFMKDGTAPQNQELQLVVEAAKEGFVPTTAPLRVPSDTEELKLVLPPLGGAPAADSN